jgi:N-acetylmuramic acid 6-phosphate etherase
MSTTSNIKAEEFLSIASQFKLGRLVTEASNPATCNLSDLAKNNLQEAIAILKELDIHTLKVLEEKKSSVCYMKDMISETLKSGNDIYFCGCGATGRLSLTIETLWRQENVNNDLKDRVFSFMAGGDVALIRSIENFEDYPLYGARQLLESGFKDGDLLIGTTEGGETPFVIGAVEKAAILSKRKPFFLYCNPDNLLCEVAERSKLVIGNPDIEKICLTVGPMAVTGSTRMQSSTILLAAAGIALFYHNESNDSVNKAIDDLFEFWNAADISFIEKFIIKETDFYKNGEYLLYETDNNLGITVITDTTERSPTFSLYPFENINEEVIKLSLCYLYMPVANNSDEAWNQLLWRSPRTLEWSDIYGIASMERLLGFDFSKTAVSRREHVQESVVHHIFRITSDNYCIKFLFGNESHSLKTPFETKLFTHLILKMILNIHSTLIMGRLGRYEGNVMTYVRASNNKLIDRAIRYITMILSQRNISLPYEEICHVLFEMIEITPGDHSIVLASADEIEKRQKASGSRQ